MSLSYINSNVTLTNTSSVNTFLDASAGGFTVTLPNIMSNGMTLSFRRVDNVPTNIITIQTYNLSQTIEGQTSLTFFQPNINLISLASMFLIIYLLLLISSRIIIAQKIAST